MTPTSIQIWRLAERLVRPTIGVDRLDFTLLSILARVPSLVLAVTTTSVLLIQLILELVIIASLTRLVLHRDPLSLLEQDKSVGSLLELID